MIIAATEADIEYFGKLIDYAPTAHARGIKYSVDGDIKVMVAYDQWTHTSCQMHFWVGDPKFFTRRFLHEAFHYPMVQCGRSVVLGIIPADNTRSTDIARRAGFVEKYRLVNGWDDGVDLVLHELHKRDCKWLGDRGRLQSAGAQGPTSHHLKVANG